MGERVRDEIVVEAPPDRVMEVITDFETYPEWAENIRDVEIREVDPQGRASKVWYYVDARVVDVTYVLTYAYEDHRLTWWLDESDQITQLDGEYLLSGEDGRTRVRYTLEIEIAFPVPTFLKQRAAKMVLETGLRELKRRVETLADTEG